MRNICLHRHPEEILERIAVQLLFLQKKSLLMEIEGDIL